MSEAKPGSHIALAGSWLKPGPGEVLLEKIDVVPPIVVSLAARDWLEDKITRLLNDIASGKAPYERHHDRP